MRSIYLLLSFTMLIVCATEAKPVTANKKTYYTTPVREIKGNSFFQWKKFEKREIAVIKKEEKPATDKKESAAKSSFATASGKN